jgi:hypothetical protein
MKKDYEYIDDPEDIEHHENITIPVEEYMYLRERSLWVEILEQSGLEGWEGYVYAQDVYKEFEKNQEHIVH